MINGTYLLWLLLPVAAMSGWWVARRVRPNSLKKNKPFSGYLQGLNFLLNEQSDRAVELFVKMLEVDSETVEIHLALANLFRRRGEVDRAIRLHQNLIARPSLSRLHRSQAELGLALDFRHAGLYDRAEVLFNKLRNEPATRVESLENLSEIFQQEKEWDKAIDASTQLASVTGEQCNDLLAHFNCELAELALTRGDLRSAQRQVKLASNYRGKAVRALILSAQIEMARDRRGAAYRNFALVVQNHAEKLPLIWAELKECAQQLGRERDLQELLRESLNRNSSPALICALFDMMRTGSGTPAAIEFLTGQMEQNPSVTLLKKMLELTRDDQITLPDDAIGTIMGLIERLIGGGNHLLCRHCGFKASSHHWQCPSCKQWDTLEVSEELAIN